MDYYIRDESRSNDLDVRRYIDTKKSNIESSKVASDKICTIKYLTSRITWVK